MDFFFSHPVKCFREFTGYACPGLKTTGLEGAASSGWGTTALCTEMLGKEQRAISVRPRVVAVFINSSSIYKRFSNVDYIALFTLF
jgi:hypothetical protein